MKSLSGWRTAVFASVLALGCAPGAQAAHRHHAATGTPTGAPIPSPQALRPAAAAVPFGSYCFTPLGRLGPGPVAPIGSPCAGNTGHGSVAGQTVN